jgi:hypothetical protein
MHQLSRQLLSASADKSVTFTPPAGFPGFFTHSFYFLRQTLGRGAFACGLSGGFLSLSIPFWGLFTCSPLPRVFSSCFSAGFWKPGALRLPGLSLFSF